MSDITKTKTKIGGRDTKEVINIRPNLDVAGILIPTKLSALEAAGQTVGRKKALVMRFKRRKKNK